MGKHIRTATARPPLAFSLGLAGVMLGFLALAYGLMSEDAQAHGAGSSDACQAAGVAEVSVGDGPSSVTYNAPAGKVVTFVCVKSGTFHSSAIAAPTDGVIGDGCFIIDFVDADTVTVTESGGSGCKDISHIDVGLANAATNTPTN